MTIPNIVTIARIIAVPVTLWLILTGNLLAAFWVFVFAGVTDGIDGYLARRLNQRTELGAYLDVAADKLLLVSVYLALAISHDIPLWLGILVISRDVMIVGAVIMLWLAAQPLSIRPLFVSKMNTAVQIGFAALILASGGFDIAMPAVIIAGTWIVAILTLASAAAYLIEWARHIAVSDDRRN